MDFDLGWIWVLIFVSVVISGLGSILWWVAVFFVAKKALDQVRRNLDQTLPALERQLRGYQQLPPPARSAQAAQIATMLMQAQKQLRQLDSLQRERYDVRVSELSSMAANAGISWTPPSY